MEENFHLKKLGRWLGAASAFYCGLLAIDVMAFEAKQLAAPPESRLQQALPDAIYSGVLSHSTMIPVNVGPANASAANLSAKNSEWTQDVFIDAVEESAVILLSPVAADWKLKLEDPLGKVFLDESRAPGERLSIEPMKVGPEQFPGKSVILPAASSGRWKVSLTQTKQAPITQTPGMSAAASNVEGFLLVKGDPSFRLYAYLDNKYTIQGSTVNLVAYVLDASGKPMSRDEMTRLQPQKRAISEAVAIITTPDEQKISLPMNDAGLDGDAIAGDGRFTIAVPTHLLGTYVAQVQVEGTRPDGIGFSRTAVDLYAIEFKTYDFEPEPASLELTGAENRAEISVKLSQWGAEDEDIFAAAEVWGSNGQGKMEAAAWIGGVVTPVARQDNRVIALGFDLRWLDRAGVHAPYQLRSLRLQTLDTNTPIAASDSLALLAPKDLLAKRRPSEYAMAINNSGFKALSQVPIAREMLMGHAPAVNNTASFNTAAAGGILMLVHGYCSGGVWSTESFTNSVEFRDYNANRSHDSFAQLILDLGAVYPSFGIVAHSQGGAAGLHLYARYWSGLDYATGGRLIQSVGTPYQGTALAGNLALLGEIFGAGCGKNTDLTYNGASNWLSTIPAWARTEVDYYTTSFRDRRWRYDYCHLATDLFLSDPDDGTTERWAGQLSGAVNMGHKRGWCHTTGMRDPAQYFDSSRNSSMNSRAAR